uniref:Uncharacterized protein n=1 Tax=Meloidogyne enterolobii TaxID=390850 RepID=A0A6V7Y1R5_MELEN|nr:unnamed protein product [Meloidogyne enterolobii]
MSFIFPHNPLPSPGTKIIAIKERSSLAPCIGEKKVIAKKAYSMGDKNYVLPPRVRAIPISDLTIFGGSSGTRRYYKGKENLLEIFKKYYYSRKI